MRRSWKHLEAISSQAAAICDSKIWGSAPPTLKGRSYCQELITQMKGNNQPQQASWLAIDPQRVKINSERLLNVSQEFCTFPLPVHLDRTSKLNIWASIVGQW